MSLRRASIVFTLLCLSLSIGMLTAGTAFGSPISAKKASLQAAQARLQAAATASQVAVEKYDVANAQLATVQGQVAANRRALKQAEQQLAIAQEELAARARDMYMAPDPGILDVVLQASSFEQLATAIDMMQRINQSDAAIVNTAATYREQVAARRAALLADQRVAAKLVKQRKTERDRVLALQSRLQQTVKSLKGELAQLIARQRAAERAARARAQAAARAAAQAAASAQASQGGGYSGGAPSGAGHPAIVSIAERYLGVPYVWGGASPSGFDCSGLVMYCYAQLGISLPHAATMQQQMSTPVPLNALQPGDLVFFGGPSFSHHVGIYVGGGQMIDAPYTGTVVRYDSIAGAWIGGRI